MSQNFCLLKSAHFPGSYGRLKVFGKPLQFIENGPFWGKNGKILDFGRGKVPKAFKWVETGKKQELGICILIGWKKVSEADF